MGYPPVVVVESGGVPRTQVEEGVSAPAFTVVESGARPITLADNAPPIALFNEDGSPWTDGPWYTEGATDIDNKSTPNRYYKSGVEYATEAEFFAACVLDSQWTAVARRSNNKLELGAYVAPGITDEIVNWSFDVDDSGWTVGQSSGGPATQVATGGELQITANGATNPRSSAPLSTTRGKAYRALPEIGRGTGSASSVRGIIGSSTGGTIVSGSSGAVGVTEYSLTFSAVGDALPLYATVITQAAAPAGFNKAIKFPVKECWPFNGFQQGSLSFRYELPTIDAADLVGTKIWLSADSGAQDGPSTTPIEKARILLRSVNGALQLLVQAEETIGGSAVTQCNLALGSLSAGAGPTVEAAVTDGFATANLNGGTPVQDTIDYIPGIAYIRLYGGQQATTNNTTNQNGRLVIYDTLTFPIGYPEPATFVQQGDSYGRVNTQITTATGLIAINKSQGGITIDQILARVQARPELYGEPTILWDGKPNGLISTADYKAKVKQIGDLIGWSNLAVAPSLKTTIGSGENATIDAVQAAILDLCTTYGGYYIDAQAILAAHGDGTAGDNADIAAGVCPRSLMEADAVHVNATGNAWVAGDAATTGTFAWALRQMGAW